MAITVNKHVFQHVSSVNSQDVLHVRMVTMVTSVRVHVMVTVLVYAQKTLDNVTHARLVIMALIVNKAVQ